MAQLGGAEMANLKTDGIGWERQPAAGTETRHRRRCMFSVKKLPEDTGHTV
jgi:hypothetical protein